MSRRLPPIPASQQSPEQAQLVALYRSSWRKVLATPDGGLGGPFDATLYSPGYASSIVEVGDYFREKSGLPPRIKELAVLIVAHKTRCGFEWHAHAAAALRLGVDLESIKAIRDGRMPKLESAAETAALEVAQQLTQSGAIDDPTFERARSALGEKVLIDLIGLVGYYFTVAIILNCARVTHPKVGTGEFPELP